MNTTKKTILTLLFVLVFALAMTVVMAAPSEQNKTAETPKIAKVNGATNNTFVMCMNSAVATKDTSYAAAKDAKKECLDTAAASNTSDAKRAAGKECSSTFKKSMKDAKDAFRTDRTACLKMKHTAWEGFKAYLQ